MKTLTIIPRKLAERDDLVVLPRREYEMLLSLKRSGEFRPTHAQKKALMRAERNFQLGKTLSYAELVKELGFAD